MKEFLRYLQDAEPGQWGLEGVSACPSMTGGILAYSHESMEGLRYKRHRRRKHMKRSHRPERPVYRQCAPTAATCFQPARDRSSGQH